MGNTDILLLKEIAVNKLFVEYNVLGKEEKFVTNPVDGFTKILHLCCKQISDEVPKNLRTTYKHNYLVHLQI